MSNLADLLPAGGGQNNTEFVADGTISSGAPVILTAAGKAAPVSSSTTAAAVQTEVEFLSSAVSTPNLVWDSTNSKAVVFYNRSGVGFCKVGSLSGSTLTWGTETTVISGSIAHNSVCFDSTGNKVIFMYEDGTGTYYTRAVVGEISGTSISFPGAVYSVWANANNTSYAVTYDSTNDRIVFAARVWSNYYGEAKVASLSGYTLTFGTAVTFESASTDMIGMGFDSTAGKVLIAYRDGGNSSYGTAIVGTVSGTSISFGSAAVFNSADSQLMQVVYDPTANKNLIAYYDSSAGYNFGVVATISGTSVSFGTPVNSSNSVTVSTAQDRAPVVYNAAIQKPVFLYQESASPYNLKYSIGTITGTAIAFSDHTTIGPYEKRYLAAVYDPATKQMITAFRQDSPDEGNSYVFNQEYTTTNLTSTNLLGLAPEAISDTATGTINTWGSRCESANLLPDSLSLGTAVEVAVANSQPESITYDTNANKIVLSYQDAGSSYHGYAAVGTVSGTSISFGTPVLINAGAHYYGSSCYDSTNNKVILVYTDGTNSNYLTAIVGTVSGTSISFGSPAVVSSQNYVDWAACAYDTNEQKVVVAYKDKGNSNYGTGVVGTVSGTSISFGTPTAFNSSDSSPIIAVYDSNAQKVVIDYWDTGNSNYGTAVVGTVSGTSISFGSPVVYNAAQVTNLGACFDSTNNKVVFTYADVGNSNYGTALVGTVSGTSISFGSEAVFVTQQAGWNKCAYDTNAQKVIVSTQNATDTSGQLYTGTVSGTDISFGAAVTFDSDGTSQNAITYDSSSNQVVLAYQAYSDSYKAKAVVGSFGTTPLTVATDYYVQTDGTLSTDTGGQLIGNAIKTNQINIKDYTG